MSGLSMPPLEALPGTVPALAFDHDLEDVLRAETLSGVSLIGAARRYRGLSTTELADVSGLGQARIEALEAGETLSREEIIRFSQTLNIPPALLTGG